MTKQELEQFTALDGEIRMYDGQARRLSRRLQRMPISGQTACASAREEPWLDTQCRLSLCAEYKVERAHALRALRARRVQLRRIISFIEGIQDSELRQIFFCRYLQGLTWQEVAHHLGTCGDGSTERKKHDRFLEVSRRSR